MEPWLVAVSICGLYLVATLVIGLLPSRWVSRSVAGYVAADRVMSTAVLYFVIGATIFSSFAFLGAPGWAYSRGAAAFYILSYGAIGMAPLYFFGPRARRLGELFGFVTQAELLAHRFGSRSLSILLAMLSVVAFIPYLTLQMKGAGLILETVSGGRIPFAWGAAVTYGVVLIYVLWSGVAGAAWTNVFQGILMMIAAWFLGLYLPYKLYGGVGAMFEQIAASDKAVLLTAPGLGANGEPWGWTAFSSAVVISAIGFSVWPHLFMKSYTAKNDWALRLTVVLYPTFQLFLLPILFIGLAGIVAFPGIKNPDTILPFLLTAVDLSPVFVGLVCAGALAASMSTGDTLLHAAASIAVCDGVAKMWPGRLEERRERRWIQVWVVVLSTVAFYFAVGTKTSLVALLLAASGGVAQIFPLVFAAFYWPRANGNGALAGLLTGVAVNVFFLKFPELGPIAGLHEGIYGLLANVVVFMGVSLLSAPEPWGRLRLYIET